MHIGLSVEGKTDSRVLREVVSRLASRPCRFAIRIHRGFADLARGVHQDLSEYRSLNTDLAVVLVDNDRNPHNRRRRDLIPKAKKVGAFYDLTVIGIAVEALESWILCDERILSKLTGKTISAQPSPDSISFPKKHLCQLIQWRTLSRTYSEILHDVAQNASMDLIRRRSPSFKRFSKDFSTVLKRIT